MRKHKFTTVSSVSKVTPPFWRVLLDTNPSTKDFPFMFLPSFVLHNPCIAFWLHRGSVDLIHQFLRSLLGVSRHLQESVSLRKSSPWLWGWSFYLMHFNDGKQPLRKNWWLNGNMRSSQHRNWWRTQTNLSREATLTIIGLDLLFTLVFCLRTRARPTVCRREGVKIKERKIR